MQQEYFGSKERLRGEALADYAISRSKEDKDFDQLTFLAAKMCRVPQAKINIIEKDKIWCKSFYGEVSDEIPRKNSFCETSIKSGRKLFQINSQDQPELFEKAKDVYDQEYHFYAGVPLVNPRGHAIAVFGIFDIQVRDLDEDQRKALIALANQSMNLFESRKQKMKLEHIQLKLKQKYQELEKFAGLVSHDIKSPLANIISLSELLKDENFDKFNEETQQYLDYLVESSYSLRNYVDGILSFYRSDHILEKDFEDVDLASMLKKITDLYALNEEVEITFPAKGQLRQINKAALSQIFMNLISNALKYNNKKFRKVHIDFAEVDHWYHFSVSDNGNGIDEKDTEKIFKLFTTLDVQDRDGNPGSGIGLATVKKLIDQMQGKIEVDSELGKGSTFKFSIKQR